MKKPTTKKQAIIVEMSKRWTTTLDALNLCGTYKLSARVAELEKDFVIERKWLKSVSKYGFPVHFMAYRINKLSAGYSQALKKHGLV